MVKEGLLRNDSPRRVWQISEAGKKFLTDASSTESVHDQTKTVSSTSQNNFIQEGYHGAQRLSPISSEKDDIRRWAMGIIETGGLLPVEQFIERFEGALAEKAFGTQTTDNALAPETKAAMRRVRIRQYLTQGCR